jgi:hypothetical protein
MRRQPIVSLAEKYQLYQWIAGPIGQPPPVINSEKNSHDNSEGSAEISNAEQRISAHHENFRVNGNGECYAECAIMSMNLML